MDDIKQQQLRLAKFLDSEGLSILEELDSTQKDFENKVEMVKEMIKNTEEMSAEATKKAFDLVDKFADIERLKGEKGDRGDRGEVGEKGDTGLRGKDGKDGKDGRDGRDGRDGKDANEVDTEEISTMVLGDVMSQIPEPTEPDTPDQVIDKVNLSTKKIRKDKLEGIEDLERMIVSATAIPVTTNFFNGLRAKNLNIVGATATQSGDTVNITTASSGGGHTIQDEGTPLTQRTNLNFVGTGVAVTDDAGNDATKVTISGGGSGLTKETPTGTVDDSNTTFTVSNEPFYINVNGAIYEEGDGIYTSYVAGTITLSSPIGTGGFIKSYYA